MSAGEREYQLEQDEMQASGNHSAGAEPWRDVGRMDLRRRNRSAGWSGMRGRKRTRLETHGMGIGVGTILAEVRKTTTTVSQAMDLTTSSAPVSVARSYV